MLVRRLRYRVPDSLDESGLAARLRAALVGHSATSTGDEAAVLWEDRGDQVLVHVASLQVRMVQQVLVVAVDMETDQTGRAPLILRFLFGATTDAAGLVPATEDLPHGNPILAARWGRIFQDVIWAGVLGTARDHAAERDSVPKFIHVLDGHITLQSSAPVALARQAIRAHELGLMPDEDEGEGEPR